VQCDLVTQRAHNVVSIRPQSNDDARAAEREDPQRNRDLVRDLGGAPHEVDGGVGSDGVTDVEEGVSEPEEGDGGGVLGAGRGLLLGHGELGGRGTGGLLGMYGWKGVMSESAPSPFAATDVAAPFSMSSGAT
jgi:hypothetical protein